MSRESARVINTIAADKLAVKTGVLATRHAAALSHLIPFATHLFSRVSAEILTYAGHYPVYRMCREAGGIIIATARRPSKTFGGSEKFRPRRRGHEREPRGQ